MNRLYFEPYVFVSNAIAIKGQGNMAKTVIYTERNDSHGDPRKNDSPVSLCCFLSVQITRHQSDEGELETLSSKTIRITDRRY